MEMTRYKIDRLKTKIATTLYYFENYIDKNFEPKTAIEYNEIEESAIAFYKTDAVFYRKVNVMTNILWATMEETDANHQHRQE